MVARSLKQPLFAEGAAVTEVSQRRSVYKRYVVRLLMLFERRWATEAKRQKTKICVKAHFTRVVVGAFIRHIFKC